MSELLLPRGIITDALVALLEDSDLLSERSIKVGDGVPPDEAGWPSGKAGTGTFVASVTVSTGDATVRDRDPINSRHSSWVARYGLRTVGAARSQADNAADLVRQACSAFTGQTVAAVDQGVWKVNDAVFNRLAAVTVDKSTDPPTWVVEDVLDVWLDRSRSTG
jgi:hypothetical protein